MIDEAVPRSVWSAEMFGGAGGHQSEIAAHFAGQLLDAFGAGTGLLGHGSAGEPLWPAGFRGSITHCAGYLAVVVAPEPAVPCLGVDAEPAQPLPAGVLAEIALPAERRRLIRAAKLDRSVPWDRLLFCAKEAVYKEWYPTERSWLDFADIEVWPGPRQLRMVVHAGRRLAFRGRWSCRDGVLVVAVTGRFALRRYRYWPVLPTVSMERPASLPLPETSVRM